MRSIVVTTIEDYIIKGQSEKAFEYMKETAKELLKNKELHNNLLELQSRFNKLKHQLINNIIDENHYSIESSKINSALIQCKNTIEDSINSRDNNAGLSSPEIELLIYTNAYAFVIKDVEILSKTFHSEIREEQIKFTQQFFQQTQLELIGEVKSIEILELSEEFATAAVVQVIKRKNKTDLFRDNQIKVNNTFAKENGRWKIFSSLIQEIKYF